MPIHGDMEVKETCLVNNPSTSRVEIEQTLDPGDWLDQEGPNEIKYNLAVRKISLRTSIEDFL